MTQSAKMSLKTLRPVCSAKPMPAAQTCEQAKARVDETRDLSYQKSFLICLGFNMTLLKLKIKPNNNKIFLKNSSLMGVKENVTLGSYLRF